MISDPDIWRADNLLIRKHGADAELEAAKRADLMLERGDPDGQLVWFRIRRAIVDVPRSKTRARRRIFRQQRFPALGLFPALRRRWPYAEQLARSYDVGKSTISRYGGRCAPSLTPHRRRLTA